MMTDDKDTQDLTPELDALKEEIGKLKEAHEKEIASLKEENNTLKTKLVNYLTVPPEGKKSEEETKGLACVDDWILKGDEKK